ncbi:hypothetical protein [Streptomyces cyaneofuscatus]|uniref:hypothetical protein n=1 Tax=Streptomyces cyaneofuscatus TaxID=66883 RepID=UPI0036DEC095
MRDPDFIARVADAIDVMGQAAHDYGPASPEARGAAQVVENMHKPTGEDNTQDR